MKSNDIKKMLSKSVAELAKDVAEAREKLWETERDVASGKLKDVHAVAKQRQNIARMLTAIHNAQKVQ